MAGNEPILQLSLFESTDNRQANYTALFDLAPRYLQRTERKKDSGYLGGVYREFTFNGEKYALSITPARIRDSSNGTERDELPGEREQLVEDVIRKLASDGLSLGDQEEVMTTFSVYQICMELQKHRHTFSKTEVKEALQILHRSVIEITKVVENGGKKQKAIVSASVFPTLIMRDESDPDSKAYVQLNPFLAQAIKSLAFEQVDYEWMMQIKGQMTRWVFKSISLELAGSQELPEFMEVRASDIARNHGTQWSRWRDMLAQVHKSVTQLVDVRMISDFTARDVMVGKRKDDVVYTLRFSPEFMRDRKMARAKGKFVERKANTIAGRRSPDKWVPITQEMAAGIIMDGRKELQLDFG